MQQISLETADVSYPVSISSGGSESGPRLGGRSPLGVEAVNGDFRYFFTVSLPGTEDEVSVFLHPNTDVLIQASGRIATSNEIEVVRHAASVRSKGGVTDSHLTEHPLSVGLAQSDSVEEDGEVLPFSGHKMGGRPYFVEAEPELADLIHVNLRTGFVHLFQLDFPGNESDAEVSGPWPLGTGMLHLIAHWSSEGFDWSAFWEL